MPGGRDGGCHVPWGEGEHGGFYVGPGSPTRFEPWCQHITSQNTSQFGHRHLEYGRERTQHMTCEREGSPSPPDSMHEPAVDSTGLAAQAVGCVSSCPKALVPGFVQSKTQRSIGITPLHRDVGLNPIRLGSGGHRGLAKPTTPTYTALKATSKQCKAWKATSSLCKAVSVSLPIAADCQL